MAKFIDPIDSKIHHYMVTGADKTTGKRTKQTVDPYFFKGGHEEALEAAKKYMAQFFDNATLWAVLGGPKGKRVSLIREADPAKQTKQVDKVLVMARKRLTKLGIFGELAFSNADKSIRLSRANY